MTGRLCDSFPLAAVEETVSLPEEPRLHAAPGQLGTLLDICERFLTSLFLANSGNFLACSRDFFAIFGASLTIFTQQASGTV